MFDFPFTSLISLISFSWLKACQVDMLNSSSKCATHVFRLTLGYSMFKRELLKIFLQKFLVDIHF